MTITMFLSALAVIGIVSFAFANEMPLEGFPAGGIVVRDENNIQIEREDLYISSNKIDVSYIFKNYSNEDIVTEVAFPIPIYSYDPSGVIKYPIHGDFTVEVNGVRQEYKELTRAIIGGKDCTDKLTKLNVSIKDFNESRWGYGGFSRKFFKLSKSEQQKLIDGGVVTIDEYLGKPYAKPAWSVQTTYYWPQIFSTKRATSIKHTYTPNPSDMWYRHGGKATENDAFSTAELTELYCLNVELIQWKNKAAATYQITVQKIDYILTTANHWKQPIKEFHLIIEADPAPDVNERVTTCFNRSALNKINYKRYETIISDFIPKEEINVYFLHYNLPR